MKSTESEVIKIQRRVRIRPNAKIFVGWYGTATSVTNNLVFYVCLDAQHGIEGGMYFDYDELEFIDEQGRNRLSR